MSSAPTPRTTPGLVMGIVSTQAGIDLTPFIAIANELTTDVCTYKKKSYTDGFVGSRMELIERWLAAHFYTVFDNQLTQAKAGTVSVGYQYKVDFGLKTSMYGQQAMALDTNLGLAKHDNLIKTIRRIKVSVGWLGTKRRWTADFGDSDYGGLWASLTVCQ